MTSSFGNLELGQLIQKNRDLKVLNWWRVGGEAEYYSEPADLEQLKAVWAWAIREKLKVWVISGGTNVLVQDGRVRGMVLSTHQLKGVELESPETSSTATADATDKIITITCWAGTPKSDVAKIFLQNRLAPAVFLTGIPGDMAAGVVMNAGIGEERTPREFCEIVKSVLVLRPDSSGENFSLHKISGRDIRWEYRHSSGWQPGILVKVTVAWPYVPDAAVPEGVRAQTKKRVATQPLDLPNCGSVFRNPLGHKSAQLIEGCDLKGFRVGGACVSTKHANFIVNDQNASANDVDEVIRHVRRTVLEKTGVELKTEVVYIGDWPR